MQCAAEQVFQVPELLELVLFNLPQKDLLLCQRVNRSFCNTVKFSPKLQKALFFMPDWSPRAHSIGDDDRTEQKPTNNRLLRRAFPGSYPTVSHVMNRSHDQTAADDWITSADSNEQWSWDVAIQYPSNGTPDCCPATQYPEASWRRMHLSQPPCTSLHLFRRWHRSGSPAMVREAGLTMGDFVYEASKTQPRWHKRFISSDKDWHFAGHIQAG